MLGKLERGLRMQDFTCLCESTSKRLGRELRQREIDFLLWLYEQHMSMKETPQQTKLD